MQHQQHTQIKATPFPFSGILELDPRGGGYIRTRSLTLQPQPGDVMVTPRQLRDNNLRPGSVLEGIARQGRNPHPI
ncbi:partial Transcription termination factor Rho, partial [Anaerolineae bacterium]